MDQEDSSKVTLQAWTGHTPCRHPAGSEVGELLTVNLKTFLVSILSPGLTDHGKYST